MTISKQVIRGPDGSINVQYMDDDTGKQVLGYLPEGYATDGSSSGGYAPENYYGETASKKEPVVLEELPAGGGEMRIPQGGYNNETFGEPTDRSSANNYGYEPNSIVGSVMGLAPGPIGLTGRALKTVENINNAKAAQAAAKTIGVKDIVGPSTLGGAVRGVNKGHVADVTIDGKTYSVGLEATDAQGRTTLNPEEARMRGLLSKTGIKKATEEEVEAAKQEAKKTGIKAESKLPGLAGVVVDAGKKVADKVLGPKTRTMEETIGPQTATQARTEATEDEEVDDTPTSVSATQAAPVGAVSRTGLGTTAPTNESISRNPFDTQQSAKATSKKGLQAVADVTQASAVDGSIGYSHPDRGLWSAGLTPDTIDASRALAGQLGQMNVTSASRPAGINAAVGGRPQSSHLSGKAIDISLDGMSDEQKAKAVENAKMAGFTGIGAYSTNNSLHLDMNPRDSIARAPNNQGIAYGMYDFSQSNLKEAPGWFTKGLTQVTVPTPTPRPDPLAPAVAAAPTTTLDAIDNMTAATSAMPDNYGIAPSRNSVPAGQAVTAAGWSSVGLGAQYSDDQKGTMAATLAGELGPATLAGLARDDPQAKAEASAVLGTLDNRAQSSRFSKAANPVDAAAVAGYDAFSGKNIQRTIDNLQATAPQVTAAVGDYLSGKTPSPAPDTTHYANYDVAGIDTSWAGAPNSVQIGQHTFSTPDKSFGSLANYGLGVGPVSGKAISTPSGLMADPASTFGSPSNPTGFGSVTGMSPSANYGLGSAIGGVSLGGWGPSQSNVGVSGVSKDTTDSSAAAASAAADSAASAGSVGGDKSDGSSSGSQGSDGASGSGLGGASPGGKTGFGASAGKSDNDNDGKGGSSKGGLY